MNFSPFVAPFSISTTLNNQFSNKFTINNAEINGSNNNNNIIHSDAINSGDINSLKLNAESMVMAVNRHQNTNQRFGQQQSLLNKYYRDNCLQISEEIPINSVTSLSPSTTVSSISLITSKLRSSGDNITRMPYSNLRCALSQPFIKQDVQVKRSTQNEVIRLQDICNVIKKEEKESNENANDLCSIIPLQSSQQQSTNISVASWQNIAAVAAAVAAVPTSTSTTAVSNYLSHLPSSSLPISLHNLFKYSTENVKKEVDILEGVINVNHVSQFQNPDISLFTNNHQNTNKKKKRKKPSKEKKPKPKPGEIRMTTALDGSTLFCCPECHMAYPDKNLLEQHLLGHTIERRFFCDICGAGLKRKDHLTRHKQSHNPDRPHACSVCSKAFKRKEQLALHYVIHSGEKRHVCTECGKGFYRKDHLRKHTRSHIARRVKAELSQYIPVVSSASNIYNSTS
ncbi:hypothetical protein PGB90_008131 [Kerria lacca]